MKYPNKFDSENLIPTDLILDNYYNINIMDSNLKLFKELELLKQRTKKTSLYLIKIQFYEDHLELIPEYRNESKTKWSICVAKRDFV